MFLIVYTVSQTTGYNNFGNAQRYFCADTEQSAKSRRSLHDPLTIGSVIFYLPPLIARVALPELGTVANGLRQPSEAAYIAMGIRVLPPGMIGVLLAAMLASSMLRCRPTTTSSRASSPGSVSRLSAQGRIRPPHANGQPAYFVCCRGRDDWSRCYLPRVRAASSRCCSSSNRCF